MELITGENDLGRRLDRVLRKALPGCPLSLVHKLLRQRLVFVDGKVGKAQDHLGLGVKIEIPSLKDANFKPKRACSARKAPDSLPSPDIIWEGCGLLAVNKPVGIAVHGAGSLDDMVRLFLADKLPDSLSFKPGPLHRLDKPSSGIVVFSASLEGARLFSSLLQEQRVRKTYLAIVEGTVKKEEIWQDRLVRDRERKKTFVSNEQRTGNREQTAITRVKPVASADGYSLIKAEIVTGRTHQIRAQAAAAGYPLLGDVKYGGRSREQRIENKGRIAVFFLHAWKLEFLEYSIEAPLPVAFKDALCAMGLNFL